MLSQLLKVVEKVYLLIFDMKLYLQKTFQGLKPCYDSDQELFKKIPFDVPLEFEVKVARNIKFHKKLFALLNLTYQNQEEFKSFEVFRQAVIIGAGFFDVKQRLHGEEVIEAKSISFAKMDNTEFELLYNAVLDTIIDYFKFPRKGLEEEIAKFY